MNRAIQCIHAGFSVWVVTAKYQFGYCRPLYLCALEGTDAAGLLPGRFESDVFLEPLSSGINLAKLVSSGVCD